MKAVDPASLPLRDIHLPPVVSWWPPAPGWWLLGMGLTLGPLLIAAWITWRRRTRLRRAALREVHRFRTEAGRPHDTAMQVSLLLRRISLAFDPHLPQATLLDAAWLARLGALAPGLADAPALRDALLLAPYDERIAIDSEALLDAVERWVRALPSYRAKPRDV